MPLQDAEFAAGLEFEQLEDVPWSMQSAEDDKQEQKPAAIDLVEVAAVFTTKFEGISKRKYTKPGQWYVADAIAVIPNRSTKWKKETPKWETMLVALIQAFAMMFPEIFGDASKLYWNANAADEVAEAKSFLKNYEQDISQEHIHHLSKVWELWTKLLVLASHLGSHVFDQHAYDVPTSLTWTEFVGIATAIASYYKKYLQSEEELDDDGIHWFYDKRELLELIDQLRRYFRCRIPKCGARRIQGHWAYCYFVIVTTKDLAIGKNSHTGKTMGPDPALAAPEDEYDAIFDGLTDTSSEGYSEPDVENDDMDVEMTGTTEGEQSEAENPWAGLINPDLDNGTDAASIENAAVDVEMAGAGPVPGGFTPRLQYQGLLTSGDPNGSTTEWGWSEETQGWESVPKDESTRIY